MMTLSIFMRMDVAARLARHRWSMFMLPLSLRWRWWWYRYRYPLRRADPFFNIDDPVYAGNGPRDGGTDGPSVCSSGKMESVRELPDEINPFCQEDSRDRSDLEWLLRGVPSDVLMDIRRAAKMKGMGIGDFVVSAARKEARRVIDGGGTES